MTKYNKRMYVIDRIEYDIKFSDTFGKLINYLKVYF